MWKCSVLKIVNARNDSAIEEPKGEMVSRLSSSALLYLNLALGLLVAVANGAALTLVLTGRAGKLAGQGLEIAMWFAAGLILVVTAGYAIRRNERTAAVLRLQTYLIMTLVLALAAWALTILIGSSASSVRVVWAVGYLSLTALYCAILGSHAFAEPHHFVFRQLLSWVLVPACVLIDILTYMKLTSTP